MNTDKVLSTFVNFYLDRGHRRVTGTSLIPEPHDPVLFTTSGMHPLTPYLDGRRSHPQGNRLVNVQRCLRTTDLDDVGDPSHLTVFEMLGSWSLGDYGHSESIRWGYELLTDGFGLRPDQLHVTVFGGDDRLGPDTRSLELWTELGLPVELLGEDNWWSNGPTGPCGPDTEIFFWTGTEPPTGTPSTDDRWVEFWNHVNMSHRRYDDGSLRPLDSQNVDTGMGLERLVMLLQGQDTIYGTDLFEPWTRLLGGLWQPDTESLRVLTDHLRSSIVVVGDGVRPSNTGRGYVLRRLLRRTLTTLWRLDPSYTLDDLPDELVRHTVDHFRQDRQPVRDVLRDEERKFQVLLERGRDRIRRVLRNGPLGEPEYRFLRDTHGLPRDVVDSILEETH
jgi:alanyl-tRNA synthetase